MQLVPLARQDQVHDLDRCPGGVIGGDDHAQDRRVRGNLQKDVTAGTEQFPGQPPSYELIANNKGLAAGDTWTLSTNIVNEQRPAKVKVTIEE